MRLQDLTAGIIGTGFIGPVHLEALRRLGVFCGTIDFYRAAHANGIQPRLHAGVGLVRRCAGKHG